MSESVVSEMRRTANGPVSIWRTTVLWVTSVIWGAHLHKAGLLNTLQQMVESGHNTSLIVAESTISPRMKNSNVNIISIHLGYVPVISPIMYAVVLFFFLPLQIVFSRPDFLILEPDVLVFGSIPSVLVSKMLKTKSILDIRSIPVEIEGFRGFLKGFCFDASVLMAKRLLDGVTTITSSMKDELSNRFHLNSEKVGVWTTGVSTTLFDPKNCVSDSIKLRRDLGLSDKFVVFYHGVFSTNRGLTQSISAIKMLESVCSDIVLFLLGTGPTVSVLDELIQKQGLQDKVIIHKPVVHSEVPKYIGMSDVCISPLPNHPYWRSQCPLKLLEYLAMEKVVVATDIPPHRSIVGRSKCCICVKSVRPADIAEAIAYAYDNRERLENWGKLGRAIVEKQYTWQKVVNDLENYLFSINCGLLVGATHGKE